MLILLYRLIRVRSIVCWVAGCVNARRVLRTAEKKNTALKYCDCTLKVLALIAQHHTSLRRRRCSFSLSACVAFTGVDLDRAVLASNARVFACLF